VPVSLASGTAGNAGDNQSAAARLAEATKAKVANSYLIGPHDVLEVSVFKVPELTKSVQVADAGTINLPLVGEVPAAGRTAQAVEQDLTAKLGGKYLQSPQVSVFVKEFNSQRITVDGSVKKPGVFPYRASVSLLQAIAMADGLDKDSDSSIVVFRNKAGKQEAARFDVSEIREGRQQDPKLEPGDMVVAGSSMIKTVFNNVMKALPVAGFFLGL
jgi:polysaccharide export outer membrane protein